jgi:hypothetical protein
MYAEVVLETIGLFPSEYPFHFEKLIADGPVAFLLHHGPSIRFQLRRELDQPLMTELQLMVDAVHQRAFLLQREKPAMPHSLVVVPGMPRFSPISVRFNILK